MRQSPVVNRIIVPLDRSTDQEQLLLSATVLAGWFHAPLQLVTPIPEDVERYEAVASGLGIPLERVLALPSDRFIEELVAQAEAHPPSLCVAAADSVGLELARCSDQPTFFVARGGRQRLATGPLILAIVGTESDMDGLAVSATWAQQLGVQIRLMIDADRPAYVEVFTAQNRLDEMGIDSDIDRIRGDNVDPVLVMARSREATAVVLPADRLDDGEFVLNAVESGVSVLVAPTNDRAAERAERAVSGLTRSGPRHHRDDPGGGTIMEHDECIDLLTGQNFGRLGYVDDGWPVVVPVNFSVNDGDLFIRSLPGAKLQAARRNEIACLEVDHVDPDTKSGWSVLAHGPLEVITDPHVLRTAWDHDPVPWADAEEWSWLRIRPLSVAGRRIPGRR